jgi:hypothetical protein
VAVDLDREVPLWGSLDLLVRDAYDASEEVEMYDETPFDLDHFEELVAESKKRMRLVVEFATKHRDDLMELLR